MPSMQEHYLGSSIERASRQVVWQTPFEKSAMRQGVYEALGDFARPADVTFYGLGLGRARNGNLIVEAYCQSAPSAYSIARKSVAALLQLRPNDVAIVPCWGFTAQLGWGDAGGHAALVARNSYGTVGGFAADLHSSLMLAVSNNHVFAECNNAAPGDDLLHAHGVFGDLHRFVQLVPQPSVNVLDGAVGRIRLATQLRKSPKVSGTRAATRGLRVQKIGAASGHTTGTVVSTFMTSVVSYPIGLLNFRRCLRIVGDRGPFSVPGDSGSIVFDGKGAVVGIIFAGDETGGYSLANPVDSLTALLGIAF